MNKFLVLPVLLTSVIFSQLSASSTFSGQKIYLKECRVCHKGSSTYLDKYTVAQWKLFLDKDGSTLSKIHLDKEIEYVTSKDDTIKNSHSFFQDKKYKKKFLNLKDFIIKHVDHSEKSFYKH